MESFVVRARDPKTGSVKKLKVKAASRAEAERRAMARGLEVLAAEPGDEAPPPVRSAGERGDEAAPRRVPAPSSAGKPPSWLWGTLAIVGMAAVAGGAIVGAYQAGLPVPKGYVVTGVLLLVGAPFALLGLLVVGAGVVLERATGGVVDSFRLCGGAAAIFGIVAVSCIIANGGESDDYTTPALLSVVGCLASVVGAFIAQGRKADSKNQAAAREAVRARRRRARRR